MADIVEFVEELHAEINPIIKVFRLLKFFFKADRVSSEKVIITTQLRKIESEADRRFETITNQLVEIRSERNSALSHLEQLYLERVFIRNAMETLNSIYNSSEVSQEIRDIAFKDKATLSIALSDSLIVSKLVADKMPDININLGHLDIKKLN